jgi:hypothetical protein
VIYEMRSYEAMPGRRDRLVKRFADVTHGLFLKYGFRPVGYWTESVGDNSKLHYILAWEDDAERVAKWAEFSKDPARARGFPESAQAGPLVARVVNAIWTPTAFSPMQ